MNQQTIYLRFIFNEELRAWCAADDLKPLFHMLNRVYATYHRAAVRVVLSVADMSTGLCKKVGARLREKLSPSTSSPGWPVAMLYVVVLLYPPTYANLHILFANMEEIMIPKIQKSSSEELGFRFLRTRFLRTQFDPALFTFPWARPPNWRLHPILPQGLLTISTTPFGGGELQRWAASGRGD